MKNKSLVQALVALDAAESAVSEALFKSSRPDYKYTDAREEYKGGVLKFTGWKFALERQGSDGGFVAQWVWYRQDQEYQKQLRVFVNLPGGQFGTFVAGDHFEIGSTCVSGNESEEDIRLLTDNGKKKLLKLVDALLDEPTFKSVPLCSQVSDAKVTLA